MNHAQFLKQKEKRNKALHFFTKMKSPAEFVIGGDHIKVTPSTPDEIATRDAVSLLRKKRRELEGAQGAFWVRVLLGNAANHVQEGKHV